MPQHLQPDYDPADACYYELYEHARHNLTRKPSVEAHQPGVINHIGPPLDFSFLKLQDVLCLKKERERGGKRKPIEKDEDEEDTKKNDQLAALDDKDNGDKLKDQREAGPNIVKANHIPDIQNLLAKNAVTLNTTKNTMGGRKVDDGKEETQRKKKIEYHVNSLLLNNNEIRDIHGLYDTLTFVLPHSDPSQLQWLNLSYNFLIKIENEILNFVNLKSLQLHGNYIADIEQVKKLGKIGTL